MGVNFHWSDRTMTDRRAFHTVYALSAALLAAAEGIAAVAWGTLPILTGLAVGWILGAVPVATWQVMAPRMLRAGGWGGAVGLLAGKLLFYGAVLYVLVGQGRVDAAAVGVGITLVPLTLPVVFLFFRPRPAGRLI